LISCCLVVDLAVPLNFVSVILPVYNAIRPSNGHVWIYQAIDTVIRQLDVHLELIIVNDGPVDDTDLAVDRYAWHYQLHIITLSRNRVYPFALNVGIGAARGELIARINADGFYLSPYKIASQLEIMRRGDYDVVGTHGITLHDGDSRYTPIRLPERHERIVELLQRDCPMLPGSLLFRKDVWRTLGGFSVDPRFCLSGDYEFVLCVACHPRRFTMYNIPEPLYAQRDHADRVSTSPLTRQLHLDSKQAVRAITRPWLISASSRRRAIYLAHRRLLRSRRRTGLAVGSAPPRLEDSDSPPPAYRPGRR
jgi:glycosyltransferase involved in cell wall biosynthesis